MPETNFAFHAASRSQRGVHSDVTPQAPGLPLLEDLYARQFQLRALLAVTLDEQGSVLRLQSQEIRDGFLLACSMMGEEVRQLAEVLQKRLDSSHAT